MIRIAASVCFFLTLLCPIFCLAGVDDGCSDFGGTEGRNCEAMSVGAVIAKTVIASPTLAELLPAIGQFPPIGSFLSDVQRSMRLASWNRLNADPPPAATRRALLQSYLI